MPRRPLTLSEQILFEVTQERYCLRSRTQALCGQRGPEAQALRDPLWKPRFGGTILFLVIQMQPALTAKGAKPFGFAPFKSRTPGTTVTVASSRIWRGWRRYRRPALVTTWKFAHKRVFCQGQRYSQAPTRRLLDAQFGKNGQHFLVALLF